MYNKLILVTRNPKELLYRRFLLDSSALESPSPEFIDHFLTSYLQAFSVYESWYPDNRKLVFYEDFIANGDSVLLELLRFMEEEPLFLEDFLNNKQQYLSQLLESYAQQHVTNRGGTSSRGNPKPIYYTKDVLPETLQWIDQYIQNSAPQIWEKYLKRFQNL